VAGSEVRVQIRRRLSPNRGWQYATTTVFATSGFALATFFSRLPTARDNLEASTAQMSILLLRLSVGSIAGLSLAPGMITRWGTRRGLYFSLGTTAAGLTLAGLATDSYASLPAGCAALAVSVSRTAALTWGIGISLGFPACISAAADHPTNADRRVSFVSICGYATFLVGPPTIGFIAEHAGILDAFWLAAGTLAKALLCAGDTPKSIMNTTPRRLRPKGNVVCRSQNWHCSTLLVRQRRCPMWG